MEKYIRQPWNKKHNHEKCICGHIRLYHNGLDEGCDKENCPCIKFKLKEKEMKKNENIFEDIKI